MKMKESDFMWCLCRFGQPGIAAVRFSTIQKFSVMRGGSTKQFWHVVGWDGKNQYVFYITKKETEATAWLEKKIGGLTD